MGLNLYFKTDELKSNKGMALYFYDQLRKEGLSLGQPENEDYMYSIKSSIDGEKVTFYMGKNNEESTPALWQVWPEQKISLLKRLFGKPNREPEEKAKLILDEVVSNIKGVSSVEWGK